MSHLTLFLISAIFVATLLGCAKRELRGKSVRSADGKTYLVLDDDNGGGCKPFYVDGREWSYAIHSPGPIEPGSHSISCMDPKPFIEFEIKPGTTFHFDYWGP